MRTRVHPDNGAREGRYLALAIVAILLIGAMALPYHQQHSDLADVAANQVPVEQLNKSKLGVLRDLNIAQEELQFYQQDEQRWPSVDELADEFIAPFSDQQWQWQQADAGIYLGHNGQWSLLLDGHSQQIWLLNDIHANYAAPLAHFLEQQWQQVLFDHGDHH